MTNKALFLTHTKSKQLTKEVIIRCFISVKDRHAAHTRASRSSTTTGSVTGPQLRCHWRQTTHRKHICKFWTDKRETCWILTISERSRESEGWVVQQWSMFLTQGGLIFKLHCGSTWNMPTFVSGEKLQHIHVLLSWLERRQSIQHPLMHSGLQSCALIFSRVCHFISWLLLAHPSTAALNAHSKRSFGHSTVHFQCFAFGLKIRYLIEKTIGNRKDSFLVS